MGVDNQFEPLASGEVLSVDKSAQILIGHRTFRVEELVEALRTQVKHLTPNLTQEKEAWFSQEGVSCEVLRFSANGWQKGKVRINLEFCPQDGESPSHPGSTASAQIEKEQAIATPPVSAAEKEDELDLGESELVIEHDLDLEEEDDEPQLVIEHDLDLEEDEDDLDLDDDLEMGEPSGFIDDELDLTDSSSDLDDDEFELGDSFLNDDDDTPEAPTAIYSEMEREAALTDETDDLDLEMEDASTSLDDEFDEISQSIEDELEMEEEPLSTEDELLDLGDISIDDNDDDLHFGELPVSHEEDFELAGLSTDDDLEDDDETESLLDDVWQDMNPDKL